MTKPIKTDANLEPVWEEATLAKAEAEKARSRADHSAAVVLVAHEAHAAAISKAAEHRLAADEADKRAREAAARARAALEKGLGLTSEVAVVGTPPAPTSPVPKPE